MIETLQFVTDQALRLKQQETNRSMRPTGQENYNDKDWEREASIPLDAPSFADLDSQDSVSEDAQDPCRLVLSVLKRARASYGRTALCLSGGGNMGFYHIGVILALARQGMLPRIITGTSSGSIAGAFFCTHTNAELQEVSEPGLVAAHHKWFQRPWLQRLYSLYQTGAMFDLAEWEQVAKW